MIEKFRAGLKLGLRTTVKFNNVAPKPDLTGVTFLKGTTPITTLKMGTGTGSAVITASFTNTAGDTITPAPGSVTWTPAAGYDNVVTITTSGSTATITPATTTDDTTSITVKYDNNGNTIEGTLPIQVGANGEVVFLGVTNKVLNLVVGGRSELVSVTFKDPDGIVIPTPGAANITWTPAAGSGNSTYFEHTLGTNGDSSEFKGSSATPDATTNPQYVTVEYKYPSGHPLVGATISDKFRVNVTSSARIAFVDNEGKAVTDTNTGRLQLRIGDEGVNVRATIYPGDGSAVTNAATADITWTPAATTLTATKDAINSVIAVVAPGTVLPPATARTNVEVEWTNPATPLPAGQLATVKGYLYVDVLPGATMKFRESNVSIPARTEIFKNVTDTPLTFTVTPIVTKIRSGEELAIVSTDTVAWASNKTGTISVGTPAADGSNVLTIEGTGTARITVTFTRGTLTHQEYFDVTVNGAGRMTFSEVDGPAVGTSGLTILNGAGNVTAVKANLTWANGSPLTQSDITGGAFVWTAAHAPSDGTGKVVVDTLFTSITTDTIVIEPNKPGTAEITGTFTSSGGQTIAGTFTVTVAEAGKIDFVANGSIITGTPLVVVGNTPRFVDVQITPLGATEPLGPEEVNANFITWSVVGTNATLSRTDGPRVAVSTATLGQDTIVVKYADGVGEPFYAYLDVILCDGVNPIVVLNSEGSADFNQTAIGATNTGTLTLDISEDDSITIKPIFISKDGTILTPAANTVTWSAITLGTAAGVVYDGTPTRGGAAGVAATVKLDTPTAGTASLTVRFVSGGVTYLATVDINVVT